MNKRKIMCRLSIKLKGLIDSQLNSATNGRCSQGPRLAPQRSSLSDLFPAVVSGGGGSRSGCGSCLFDFASLCLFWADRGGWRWSLAPKKNSQ